MRRELVMPLALLFIALGVPSNAQNADVTVDEGAPLTVECALRVEERAEWRLDGAAPPADLRPAGEAAASGRLTARLHAPAARAQHAGVYTCARQPTQRVRVHVRPAALAAAPAAPAAPAAAVPGTALSRCTVVLACRSTTRTLSRTVLTAAAALILSVYASAKDSCKLASGCSRLLWCDLI